MNIVISFLNQTGEVVQEVTGFDCGGAPVLRVIKFIWDLLDIIFFVVPIGLIVMVMLDLAKNVIAGKEDDMKKNLSLSIKRVIFAVVLFLIPTIVEFMVAFLGSDLIGINFMKCVNIMLTEDISDFEFDFGVDDYSDVPQYNFNRNPIIDSIDGSTSNPDFTVEELLASAKKRADYIRDNGFSYGDAPINPAINHDAKLVSCDRFVAWVLYDMGYTDQPETQGIVVKSSNAEQDFSSWCEKHGFKKITNIEDVQAGDIIFQNMNGSGPHVFLLGNKKEGNNWERYDGGSDSRIQSTQPSIEAINSTKTFSYAYRIVN